MEATTRTRPSRVTRVDVDGVIFQVKAFDEARVVVVIHDDRNRHAPVADVAETIEQALDVRFFGTSWRLVTHPEPTNLITFSGYDSAQRLVGPQWHSLPPTLAEWLPAACS